MGKRKKIEHIAELIAAEEKHMRKSYHWTIGIYTILAIFVLSYTVFLSISIRDLVTPENVAIEVNTKIAQRMPEFRSQFRAVMPDIANQTANLAVDSALQLIPSAAEFAKLGVAKAIDALFASEDGKQVTLLEDYMIKNINESLKRENTDLTKEVKLAGIISENLLSDISRELKLIVNNELFSDLNALGERLKLLRTTPTAQLTKKQAAEKKFIVYWLYLSQNLPME